MATVQRLFGSRLIKHLYSDVWFLWSSGHLVYHLISDIFTNTCFTLRFLFDCLEVHIALLTLLVVILFIFEVNQHFNRLFDIINQSKSIDIFPNELKSLLTKQIIAVVHYVCSLPDLHSQIKVYKCLYCECMMLCYVFCQTIFGQPYSYCILLNLLNPSLFFFIYFKHHFLITRISISTLLACVSVLIDLVP